MFDIGYPAIELPFQLKASLKPVEGIGFQPFFQIFQVQVNFEISLYARGILFG